jgi:hypothetical protein
LTSYGLRKISDSLAMFAAIRRGLAFDSGAFGFLMPDQHGEPIFDAVPLKLWHP